MLVIADMIGVITFVLSNLPPKPTSITPMSILQTLKYSNAIATVISKNEGEISSITGAILFVKSITNCSDIISPSTRIRSLKSMRWGEV